MCWRLYFVEDASDDEMKIKSHENVRVTGLTYRLYAGFVLQRA